MEFQKENILVMSDFIKCQCLPTFRRWAPSPICGDNYFFRFIVCGVHFVFTVLKPSHKAACTSTHTLGSYLVA